MRTLPIALLVASCGGSEYGPAQSEPPPPPAPAPLTSASATPPAPVEDAGPQAVSASPHDQDGPDGVRRWSSWDGPTAGTAVGTPRAWVIGPNTLGVTPGKPSFSSVMLRLAEVVSASEKEIVLREKWGNFAVVPALARPAQPIPGLKKGAAVRCSFGGSSVVARVEAASEKNVSCGFLFMEKPHKETVATEEVLALDGTAGLGAPVHARFAERPEQWFEGFVLAAGGEHAWVSLDTQFADGDPRAGRRVHKLVARDVRAVDLSKPLRVGEACLATEITQLAPCKVKKLIAGGLGYTVVFDGGDKPRDLPFDRVARRPKETPSKPPAQ